MPNNKFGKVRKMVKLDRVFVNPTNFEVAERTISRKRKRMHEETIKRKIKKGRSDGERFVEFAA
jgi:hypothetical protein